MAERDPVDVIEDLLSPAYSMQSELTCKIEMPETNIQLDLEAVTPVARP
jgi:hypothetical protein